MDMRMDTTSASVLIAAMIVSAVTIIFTANAFAPDNAVDEKIEIAKLKEEILDIKGKQIRIERNTCHTYEDVAQQICRRSTNGKFYIKELTSKEPLVTSQEDHTQ